MVSEKVEEIVEHPEKSAYSVLAISELDWKNDMTFTTVHPSISKTAYSSYKVTAGSIPAAMGARDGLYPGSPLQGRHRDMQTLTGNLSIDYIS